jgi:hypothetical protein
MLLYNSFLNSYLYTKAAKSFFKIPREKLSSRPLAAEAAIAKMLKDFAAKVYTIFFVQPKICNYYKMNKKNLFLCQ